jgi:hypothetical protein
MLNTADPDFPHELCLVVSHNIPSNNSIAKLLSSKLKASLETYLPNLVRSMVKLQLNPVLRLWEMPVACNVAS